MGAVDLRPEYERGHAAAEGEASRYLAQLGNLRLSLGLLLAALVWTAVQGMRNELPWAWTGAAMLALVGALVWQGRSQRRADVAGRRATFHASGLRRLQGELAAEVRATETAAGELAKAATGAEFAREGHLYQWDLDVIGPKSLFSLLATARTHTGESALAALLLDPVSADGVAQRQAAVRELASRLRLREQVALLGASRFEQMPAGAFDRWLATSTAAVPGWVRPLLLVTSAGWIAVLISGLLFHAEGTVVVRNTLAVLAVQGAVCLWLRERVRVELEAAASLAPRLRLLRGGLRLLRTQRFEAAMLTQLQAEVSDRADVAIGQLLRSLELVEQRGKEWFYLPALLLAVGTQAAISLRSWRAAQGVEIARWTASWGKFDALLALAGYAAEHAENAWPEVFAASGTSQGNANAGPGNGGQETSSGHAAAASFVASSLRHPLLPRDLAVHNDVALGGAAPQVLIVSGSNMAGKSTLLRSVGANAVLAMAGAPVAAAALRMSALRPGASLAVRDSLAEGRSKFRAEVERLAAMVTLAQREPVLFVVDEIFSGTNSADRGVAAQAVVRALVEAGAIGMLSTHDLLLTRVAEDASLHSENVHMASRSEADPLDFDYLVKPGVNTQTNGLAIVRMLGL